MTGQEACPTGYLDKEAMHKAVIFDLGRVLIDFDFGRGYRALEGVSPYDAREIPRRLAASGLVQRFETGLVEPRDFVAQLSTVLDRSEEHTSEHTSELQSLR